MKYKIILNESNMDLTGARSTEGLHYSRTGDWVSLLASSESKTFKTPEDELHSAVGLADKHTWEVVPLTCQYDDFNDNNTFYDKVLFLQ